MSIHTRFRYVYSLSNPLLRCRFSLGMTNVLHDLQRQDLAFSVLARTKVFFLNLWTAG